MLEGAAADQQALKGEIHETPRCHRRHGRSRRGDDHGIRAAPIVRLVDFESSYDAARRYLSRTNYAQIAFRPKP